MSTHAAWAGVVVSDVARSAAWYLDALGGDLVERDERWAKLAFRNGTVLELVGGDPTDPASSFPSYGADPGPPVMPGYSVEDPEGLVESQGLEVARVLPGWVVVVAPDRLRVVLLGTELRKGAGLIGFRYSTTARAGQQRFLDRLGVEGPEIADGEVAVIPVFRHRRSGELADPDGTALLAVARGA